MGDPSYEYRIQKILPPEEDAPAAATEAAKPEGAADGEGDGADGEEAEDPEDPAESDAAEGAAAEDTYKKSVTHKTSCKILTFPLKNLKKNKKK